MVKQYPMTRVGPLQGFPEDGYPMSAYYGINASLAEQTDNTASASATGGKSGSILPGNGSIRTLIVAFLAVVGAVALWHAYM